jgi:hypothetical protein
VLSAHWTFDVIEIDPPNLVGRDRASALRTHGVEGRHHSLPIDFLLTGHHLCRVLDRRIGVLACGAYDPKVQHDCHDEATGEKETE